VGLTVFGARAPGTARVGASAEETHMLLNRLVFSETLRTVSPTEDVPPVPQPEHPCMKRLPLAFLVSGLLAVLPASGLAQTDASDGGSPADDAVSEASTDSAELEPGPEEVASYDAATEPEESYNFLHGGVRAVREHAFAFGYHQTFLRARGNVPGDPDKVFNFAGPSAAYTFFRGHRFGFLMNLEFFFPIRGWQVDGSNCPSGCSTRKMYEQTLGYDATFMFAYHRDLMENLSLNAGIGIHANIIELSDGALRDFNNISMGIGSLATLRYYITERFDVGGNLSLSVDWADMIHETGTLKYTVNWALAATIGVHR